MKFCNFEENVAIMEDNSYKYQEAVEQIKKAILNCQYSAVKQVNAVQLALYYGVGKYVSVNSREGTWGSGAIAAIADQLHKELPGLRGFSETSIKNMRIFYEGWKDLDNNSSAMADELRNTNSTIQLPSK